MIFLFLSGASLLATAFTEASIIPPRYVGSISNQYMSCIEVSSAEGIPNTGSRAIEIGFINTCSSSVDLLVTSYITTSSWNRFSAQTPLTIPGGEEKIATITTFHLVPFTETIIRNQPFWKVMDDEDILQDKKSDKEKTRDLEIASLFPALRYLDGPEDIFHHKFLGPFLRSQRIATEYDPKELLPAFGSWKGSLSGGFGDFSSTIFPSGESNVPIEAHVKIVQGDVAVEFRYKKGGRWFDIPHGREFVTGKGIDFTWYNQVLVPEGDCAASYIFILRGKRSSGISKRNLETIRPSPSVKDTKRIKIRIVVARDQVFCREDSAKSASGSLRPQARSWRATLNPLMKTSRTSANIRN